MDAFHTLAEISVAIAGFSSLIIIFRGTSNDWGRLDFVNFGYVLSWSVGSIFMSLLPILLVEFGVTLAAASRIGLLFAPLYMFSAGAILGYSRNRITSGSEQASRPLWKSATGPGTVGLAMSVSALVIVSVSLSAGLGLLPGPPQAWLSVTIVLLMAHSIAEMGVFVASGSNRGDSG